jgi:selenocysteine-specific elongation factor
MLNARLKLLASCKKLLPNRSRVRLHLGTAEILCRVVNLEKGDILPGMETLVQLRLENKTAPDVGDSFVIREYSPGRTIGGGVILDTHPQKLKYMPAEKLEAWEQIADADPEKMMEFHLKENPYKLFTLETLAKQRALSSEETATILKSLIEKNKVMKLGEGTVASYIYREEFIKTAELLKRFLREFHAQNPMRLGVKKSEIKTRLFPAADNAFFDALLKELAAKGEIAGSREKIFIAGHTIEFTPEQEILKQKIAKIYLEAAFVTPEFEELVALLEEKKPEKVREVLTGMVEAGILVELEAKMDKPLIFHSQRIEEAKKMVVETIKEKGEAKFFELREKLNSTRKFTTPILTYFDEIGLTKRIGDVRVLR